MKWQKTKWQMTKEWGPCKSCAVHGHSISKLSNYLVTEFKLLSIPFIFPKAGLVRDILLPLYCLVISLKEWAVIFWEVTTIACWLQAALQLLGGQFLSVLKCRFTVRREKTLLQWRDARNPSTHSTTTIRKRVTWGVWKNMYVGDTDYWLNSFGYLCTF